MLWRRRRRDMLALSELVYGAGRSVIHESTRIEIERFVGELVKKDFADPDIRERIRQQSLEAYERCCAELYGPDWRAATRK